MRLTWLADTIRARGLKVVEYDGWETRSDPRGHYDDTRFNPVGLIVHHTAGLYYLQHYPEGHWPDPSLDDKCNITIRPDGEVHVLNAGIAYDSGMGAPEIFDAVRSDEPLPDLDGLKSTMNGTLHFIDIEVQHLGDGSPIEPVQRQALIEVNAAICDQMGWDPAYRVVGHREWAPDRKVDPRWDGVANPMPGIRHDTANRLEDDMPDIEEIRQAIREETPGAVLGAQFGGPSGSENRKTLAEFVLTIDSRLDKVWKKVAVGAVGGASATQIVNEIGQRLIGG